MNLTIIYGIAILLVVVTARSAEVGAPPTAQGKRIGVEEFEKLRGQTNVVILDVRSAAEVKAGSIPGSINIDINSLSFVDQLNALDKSKIYLVHCAVGMRSARACKTMNGLGFKEFYDLAPGYDGWKKARQALVK